uniref:Uncharacterized protein n=1 Tax=Salix viminalis TaxID=40686 RepID=A0A6N2KB99_SALVM
MEVEVEVEMEMEEMGVVGLEMVASSSSLLHPSYGGGGGGGNGNGGNGSGRFRNGGQFFISPPPILALILSTLHQSVINRSNPNKNIGFKTTFEKSHRGESKGLQKLNAAERIGKSQET